MFPSAYEQDELDYKKKHRAAKVRLVDGTNKTILIDDSSTVGETILLIGQKIKLRDAEVRRGN